MLRFSKLKRSLASRVRHYVKRMTDFLQVASYQQRPPWAVDRELSCNLMDFENGWGMHRDRFSGLSDHSQSISFHFADFVSDQLSETSIS